MNRFKKCILFIIISFIPFISVNAYEIKCDEGEHKFEEFFNCRLNGATVGENYDTLSGTITNNEYVNCLRYQDGIGLVNSNTTDNKLFAYTGKPTSDNISLFRCQVIKKAEENQQVQIFINDFKAHTSSQPGTASEQIVRSNYITVAKYVEEVTTSPTKPRDTSNSNSRLKALQDENINITFSSFITEYKAEVLYEVEKLNLIAYPFNNEAQVRIVGSQELKIGENVIDIYVTSPDGASTTCYTLTVTRLKEGEDIYYPESDSSLKNLTVTGYSIGYKPDTSEYRLHLDRDVNRIDVNAIPTVDSATINISDTNNLVNGSVISITITSADLSSQTKYKIIISKDAPKKDYTMYYILGALGIFGIIVILIIIRTNKKNNKDPLLRLKNDKRKVNRGKKSNSNDIPIAESSINDPTEANVNPQPSARQDENSQTATPNVIKADSVNIVSPMSVTEKQPDPNLNKITTNTNAINLTVSDKALPQAVMPNQPLSPNNQVANGQNVINQIPNQPAVVGNPTYPSNQGSAATPVNPANQINTVGQVPNTPINQQPMNPGQPVYPTSNPTANQVPNQVVNQPPQNDGMIDID